LPHARGHVPRGERAPDDGSHAMRAAVCLTALTLVLATPAFAQQHPGHPMPAQPAPKIAPAKPAPAPAPPTEPEDEAMPAIEWPTELPAGAAPQDDMKGMPDMVGMDHSTHAEMEEEIGSDSPPPAPTDHPADAIFGE